MDNILQKHPEILRFDEDRYQLSNSVEKYINIFLNRYPETSKQLSLFIEAFSKMPIFSQERIKELEQISGWTFTEGQKRAALNLLKKISINYPIPLNLKDQARVGEYLDLRNEIDIEKYQQKLRQFGEKIKSKTLPEPIEMSTSEIGRLTTLLIHQKDNQDFMDPIVGSRLDTIWTLDITDNPGLSIKDVMAFQMIDDAINSGTITRETIVVEGTSGNTGAGLALEAARRGMRIILIIPDKMSSEKIDRLKNMGAHTIVTPTKVDANDPRSYYNVRDFMAKEVSGWATNQYDNPSNIKAHQTITGPQIWQETKGEVTALVATAGTSGTISGIGRYLKSKNPKIKIIAIDTIGSILYLLKEGYSIEEVQKYAREYKIQGFGEDIQPKNLDLSVIDKFIRVGDKTGLNMTRLLPALGYIMGHSSGAAYSGILEALELGILGKKDRVVTIFPDTGIAYRGDVYSDQWMEENNLWI